MSDLSVQLMGPEGVQRRMAEIQAKLDAVFGAPAYGSFQGTLDGTLKPFDVNAPGVALKRGEIPAPLKPVLQRAAKNNNVDPALLDALVDEESSYDPNARSRAGALGLSQLMPDTAKALGVTNPMDPAQNLDGGAKYLRSLLDKYGDIPTALAAYNAGPGAVDKFGGIPPYAETQAYVKKIMAGYQARRAQ